MELNEKELKAQLENYFNTKSSEEIIEDLIKAGGANLLDFEKKYVAVYCSREKYNDTFVEVSNFCYKSFEKAESEIISKGYKFSKSDDIYIYSTGDNNFEMYAYIKELICLD